MYPNMISSGLALLSVADIVSLNSLFELIILVVNVPFLINVGCFSACVAELQKTHYTMAEDDLDHS